jgi:hypothetical protein
MRDVGKAMEEQTEDAEVHALDGHGGKRKQGYHITLTERGTSADDLARRIARDHPDMLQRMKAGECSSSPIPPLSHLLASPVHDRTLPPTHHSQARKKDCNDTVVRGGRVTE